MLVKDSSRTSEPARGSLFIVGNRPAYRINAYSYAPRCVASFPRGGKKRPKRKDDLCWTQKDGKRYAKLNSSSFRLFTMHVSRSLPLFFPASLYLNYGLPIWKLSLRDVSRQWYVNHSWYYRRGYQRSYSRSSSSSNSRSSSSSNSHRAYSIAPFPQSPPISSPTLL